MKAVKMDRWGYEVTTTADSCIASINAYYDQVLDFQYGSINYGRRRSVILEAPGYDKDCVLANILAAHFASSSDPSKVSSFMEAAKSGLEQATEYEKAVFDAVSYLISEDRDDEVAVELHSKLLTKFPKDLVSLKRAQLLCFYMGRPDLSLGLVQQVLPQNQQENYIYGVLAFPLLELGWMEEAEEAAKRGFEINKDDCWAQHALCHVLQYKCSFREAVEFMEQCSPSWSSCSSFMLTHNWWHVALCYLEGNSPMEKVKDIYNHRIWKELEKDDCVGPEVYVNALGLLLRVYIRGAIDAFEDRLEALASCVEDQGCWYLEWHLDVLILWALAVTGKVVRAEELCQGLKSRISKMKKKKQVLMQPGMKLAEALYQYGRGNDEKALESLGSDFDASACKMIGASDEQLDVFQEVWYSLLMKNEQLNEASEAIEKRIKTREGNPSLWRLLERCYDMSGREEEAAFAAEKGQCFGSCMFQIRLFVVPNQCLAVDGVLHEV